MKKTIVVVLLCSLAIILCVIVFKPKFEQKIVRIGEPLKLSAEEELKAGVNGTTLGWNKGTIEITVNDMTVFDTFYQAGIKPEDMDSLQKQSEGDVFILVGLHIKNVNASSDNSNEFNFSFFTPMSEDDFKNQKEEVGNTEKLVYFDRHANKDVNVKYFHSNLEKGKEIDCKIGVYVNKNILNQNKLLLKVGYMPLDKYAFALKRG